MSAGVFVAQPGTPTLGIDDVTVVVPVRDRPEQLDRLLGTLRGLACIVVDDASADATATKDVAERHGAQFVGLTINVGPSGARNAGLATAQTPIVAFVDSDCTASPGWLNALLAHFDDPLVATVAPRVVPAPTPLDTPVTRYDAMRSSLDRGAAPGLVRPRSRISYVPSAALVVRRLACEDGMLFDPVLRGGEDVDLVWRLVAAGWDVSYDPSVTVAHHGPTTVAGLLTKRWSYGSTAAPLARRHPGALAAFEASGWSVVAWIAALTRRPLLATAALTASGAVLARRLRGQRDAPWRGGRPYRRRGDRAVGAPRTRRPRPDLVPAAGSGASGASDASCLRGRAVGPGALGLLPQPERIGRRLLRARSTSRTTSPTVPACGPAASGSARVHRFSPTSCGGRGSGLRGLSDTWHDGADAG